MLLAYCFLPRISNAGLSSLLLLLVFAPQVFFPLNAILLSKKRRRRGVMFSVLCQLIFYIYILIVGLVARVVIVIFSFNWWNAIESIEMVKMWMWMLPLESWCYYASIIVCSNLVTYNQYCVYFMVLLSSLVYSDNPDDKISFYRLLMDDGCLI